MKKFLNIIFILVILGLAVYAVLHSKNGNDGGGGNTSDTRATYTEQAGLFSFKYDPAFSVEDGDKEMPTTDWRVNATTEGIILATLTIPREYMPNTNFAEAKMTFGRSTNESDIRNCTVETLPHKDGGEVTFGGVAFHKITMKDAGAGNFYDTTSYRAVLDGDCYSIDYTVHSTNIANYPQDAGITEFDEAKIKADLEGVLSTLVFQLASN